jgi:hypothetical protein
MCTHAQCKQTRRNTSKNLLCISIFTTEMHILALLQCNSISLLVQAPPP